MFVALIRNSRSRITLARYRCVRTRFEITESKVYTKPLPLTPRVGRDQQDEQCSRRFALQSCLPCSPTQNMLCDHMLLQLTCTRHDRTIDACAYSVYSYISDRTRPSPDGEGHLSFLVPSVVPGPGNETVTCRRAPRFSMNPVMRREPSSGY